MESNERAYATKEISDLLEIGDSTLRKWCLALEKNDYKFLKNDKQRRLFVDHDIIVLRHFKELVQTGNMPLENAAMVIASRFSSKPFSSGTPAVLDESKEENRSLMRSDEVVNQLLQHIEKQEEFNKNLIERLDQQQKYIEERINERDRTLMDALNKIHSKNEEIRQLQAAAQEKKGLFSRLFGSK